MSENTLPDQRTEMPSDKRMGELRKDGNLFSSRDVSVVVSLLAGLFGIQLVWAHLVGQLKLVMTTTFSMAGDKFNLTIPMVHQGALKGILMVGPDVFIIVLIIAVASSLAVLIQTNWNVKKKKIEFKFNKMNPITGIRRIVSLQGTINTLKAILKLSLILPLAFFTLKRFAPEMLNLMYLTVPEIMTYAGEAVREVFFKIIYILTGFAIFDFIYGRWFWLRQNRMTKEEVKDERKAVEGDEATKRKIIAKGLSRIAQRIHESVPRADVLITNPTHYAIALKYDRGAMTAPVVLAKGRGEIALMMRAIAAEHGVPIVERKPLARALYRSAKIGREIPYDLFKAVAEVFAYLYRIKNPHNAAATQGQ